jgi:hypothetical protein
MLIHAKVFEFLRFGDESTRQIFDTLSWELEDGEILLNLALDGFKSVE